MFAESLRTLFCLPLFWPSCSSDVNINGGSVRPDPVPFKRSGSNRSGTSQRNSIPFWACGRRSAREVEGWKCQARILSKLWADHWRGISLVANDLTCGRLRPILKVLIHHGSSAPSQCRGQKAGYLARIISLGVYDILIYFMMSNIRILIMGRMTHTIF